MKKLTWEMDNLKKAVSRLYKGYSDLLGILAGFIGFVLFGFGVFLLLCAESVSVVLIIVGGFFVFGADELFRYGRQ